MRFLPRAFHVKFLLPKSPPFVIIIPSNRFMIRKWPASRVPSGARGPADSPLYPHVKKIFFCLTRGVILVTNAEISIPGANRVQQ